MSSELGYLSGPAAGDRHFWDHHLAGNAGWPRLGHVFREAQAESTVDVALSPDVASGVSAFGRDAVGSELAPWLALVGSWLCSHGGQRECVVVMPATGRGHPFARLVGPCVNMVPVRIGTHDGDTLEVATRRVQRALFEIYRHCRLPFREVRRRTGLSRAAARGSLAEVAFQYTPAPPVPDFGPGVAAEIVDLVPPPAAFDLTVEVVAGPEPRLRVGAGRALAHADALEHLVSSLAETAARAVHRLGRTSRPVARPDLDRGAGRAPAAVNLGARLRDQAEMRPDDVAVVFGDEQVTYREAAEAVASLAGALREAGAVPGDIVGIVLPRSWQFVRAVWATVWAGAAFAPLPADLPASRLAAVIADARIGIVLCAGRPSLGDGVVTIDVTRTAGPCPAPEPVPADSPAYAMWTSGSTGRPKGVLLPAAGLANRLDWMEKAYDIGADDVVLHKSSVAFDVAVWEAMAALGVGGRVVVAPEGATVSRDLELAARAGVTLIDAVPTYLSLALRSRMIAQVPSLRAVLCGGEALHCGLVDAFYDQTDAVLYNTYGATETTIGSTYHPVRRGKDPVPVGRPIHNMAVLIASGDLEPQPAYALGEICFAGPGVALGYLNDAALTAERFPVHPRFGRLYRTGDVGYTDGDGLLYVLGRQDLQINLHGCRIEPEEVEAALCSFPGVRRAAVRLAHADGIDRLVAHVEVDEDSIAPSHLRAHLGERLPRHMLPARYVLVDRLPVGDAGKIDRAALASLPVPGAALERRDAPAPPGTDLEASLVRIWQDELGVDQVGVVDDFFELGGDSLAAVLIAERVGEELGIEFDIADIYDVGTIRDLAGVVVRSGSPTAQEA